MADIFSAAKLAKSVHDTLDGATAAIPPGRKSAVLIDATNERVRMLLAIKAGDAWTIAGGADYDGKHITGKVAIAGSW
jgi:hypothetical protein